MRPQMLTKIHSHKINHTKSIRHNIQNIPIKIEGAKLQQKSGKTIICCDKKRKITKYGLHTKEIASKAWHKNTCIKAGTEWNRHDFR